MNLFLVTGGYIVNIPFFVYFIVQVLDVQLHRNVLVVMEAPFAFVKEDIADVF